MQTPEDTQEQIKKLEVDLRQLRIKFALSSLVGIPEQHKSQSKKRKRPSGIVKTFDYSDCSTDEEDSEYDDDGFIMMAIPFDDDKDGMMRYSMINYVRTIISLAGNLHIAAVAEDHVEPLQGDPKAAKDSATFAVNEFRTALADYDEQCKSNFDHSATTSASKKFDVVVMRHARMSTIDNTMMSKVTMCAGWKGDRFVRDLQSIEEYLIGQYGHSVFPKGCGNVVKRKW